jgi:hypothetical protein
MPVLVEKAVQLCFGIVRKKRREGRVFYEAINC